MPRSDHGRAFQSEEKVFSDEKGSSHPSNSAWFNLSIVAGNKSWVAGVELATASEPPARKPRTWGRSPSGYHFQGGSDLI